MLLRYNMENYERDTKWMNEKVTKIDGHRFFYWFVCFFMLRWRKKMTYKELFLLYYGLHRQTLGEANSKKKALQTVLKIYKENNGDYPKIDGLQNNS